MRGKKERGKEWKEEEEEEEEGEEEVGPACCMERAYAQSEKAERTRRTLSVLCCSRIRIYIYIYI